MLVHLMLCATVFLRFLHFFRKCSSLQKVLWVVHASLNLELTWFFGLVGHVLNLLLETFDQDHHLSMDDYDRLNLFDISLLEVEDLILSTWRWRRKERTWKERTWQERVVDPVD